MSGTAEPDSPTPAAVCGHCGVHPATVCDECRRDLAFRRWWGISRHPESGTDCTLCEAGPASLCGLCLIAAVPEHRAMVLRNGYPVSAWPPVHDEFGRPY